MKKVCMTVFIFISLIYSSDAFGVEQKKLMPIMPRIGIDGKFEQPVKIDNTIKVNNKKDIASVDSSKSLAKDSKNKAALTYDELDIKKIADDLKGEIDDERDSTLADLRILWQSAVEKSETIRFAILKLSNPEGDQEKKGMVKKILTPLTSVAPLIGMGAGDPVLGGSTMIGSGLLNSLLADDSLINKELSRVTDTDLVLLAQELDNLQQKLVTLYYNYMSAIERLRLTDKMVANRYKYYEAAQTSSPDVLSVADVFYREAISKQFEARQEVLSARASLEQFVGNEAIAELDKNIQTRNQ